MKSKYEVGIIKIKSKKEKTQRLLDELYFRRWRVICSYADGDYLILEREVIQNGNNKFKRKKTNRANA